VFQFIAFANASFNAGGGRRINDKSPLGRSPITDASVSRAISIWMMPEYISNRVDLIG
jgi:hypothetical protein